MPTYEYRCPSGHLFERLQKMTDPPRAKCPVCGRMGVRQISGGAGLIFKGTGFYITDYGKDGKGPKKDSDSAPKPEVPAASGKESVPAPAPAKEKSDKPSKKKDAS